MSLLSVLLLLLFLLLLLLLLLLLVLPQSIPSLPDWSDYNACGLIVTVRRFGRVDHTAWCTHKAGLGGWNLFAKDFVEDKPTYVLETSVRDS